MVKVICALLLALPLWAAKLTVCASGCAYTSPQTAVDAASYGDIIELTAGETFSGEMQLKKKTGTPAYIVIRSSRVGEISGRVTPSDTAKLAKLQHTGYVLTVEQGANYYRLEGLEIQPTSGNFLYGLAILHTRHPVHSGPIDNERIDLAHHLIFDRCYLHGHDGQNGPRNGIYLNSGYTEVINSWISEIKDNDGEAKGILSWNGSGPYVFRNNHIEASSITTLMGGATPNIRGIRDSGSQYIGNHYYRPWAWRYNTGTADPAGTCMWDARGGEWYRNTTAGENWECQSGTWTNIGATAIGDYYSTKNHFELKNSQWTIFRGNYIENAYYPTFGSQRGAAILFNQVDNDGSGTLEPTATVRNVRVEDNLIRRTPFGISIGRIGSTYHYRMSGITVRNNLFDHFGEEPYSSNNHPAITQTGWVTRYAIIKNTIISARAVDDVKGYAASMNMSSTNYTTEMTVAGNVIPFFRGGFYDTEKASGGLCNSIPNQWSAPWQMSRNLVADPQNAIAVIYYGSPWPKHQLLDLNTGVSALCATLRCVGCAVAGTAGGPTDWASVGFVNYAGGNYRLDSGSAWKGWAHEGADPGADIDVVEWSTATAESGAHNPYLDFRVRALVPAATTASLRYTAYSTAACAVTVASNPGYTSPEFADAGATGNRDRSISVTGLSAEMRYWYRIVCGGTYRRSGVFWTK